ncbi:hypothetical protein EDB85DRAFT_1901759 [Lactarius pseudohatsudake]|nr:hypothetical protein EDB85DRAFT_1901759 [Lactarius pseudohatsudake]
MVYWHVSAFVLPPFLQLATATSCGACTDPKLSYLFIHEAQVVVTRRLSLSQIAMNPADPEFTAQLTGHWSPRQLDSACGINVNFYDLTSRCLALASANTGQLVKPFGLAREAKGQVVTAVALGSPPVLHRLSQIHTAHSCAGHVFPLVAEARFFSTGEKKDKVFRPSSKTSD